MKKRVLSLLLAGLMAFSLAACGGGDSSANNDKDVDVSQNEDDRDEEDKEVPIYYLEMTDSTGAVMHLQVPAGMTLNEGCMEDEAFASREDEKGTIIEVNEAMWRYEFENHGNTEGPKVDVSYKMFLDWRETSAGVQNEISRELEGYPDSYTISGDDGEYHIETTLESSETATFTNAAGQTFQYLIMDEKEVGGKDGEKHCYKLYIYGPLESAPCYEIDMISWREPFVIDDYKFLVESDLLTAGEAGPAAESNSYVVAELENQTIRLKMPANYELNGEATGSKQEVTLVKDEAVYGANVNNQFAPSIQYSTTHSMMQTQKEVPQYYYPLEYSDVVESIGDSSYGSYTNDAGNRFEYLMQRIDKTDSEGTISQWELYIWYQSPTAETRTTDIFKMQVISSAEFNEDAYLQYLSSDYFTVE